MNVSPHAKVKGIQIGAVGRPEVPRLSSLLLLFAPPETNVNLPFSIRMPTPRGVDPSIRPPARPMAAVPVEAAEAEEREEERERRRRRERRRGSRKRRRKRRRKN